MSYVTIHRVDTSRHPPMSGLGDASASPCAPCQMAVGPVCVTCPNNFNTPECQGCVNGARPVSTLQTAEKTLVVPVVVGVVTTVLGAYLAVKLLHQKH